MRVAQSLFEIGLYPQSADVAKVSSSVPDIYVETRYGSLDIEVYSPRDWQGFNYFVEEARLRLLHLDYPWDYEALFDVAYPGTGLDIWHFSEQYQNEPRSSRAVDLIMAPVIERLSMAKAESFHVSVGDPAVPGIRFSIGCQNIKETQTRLPTRIVSRTSTLTGYGPEHMFTYLLRRRIVPKLRKNQCGKAAPNRRSLKLLFVATNMLGYQSEFYSPWYRSQFIAAVREELRREAASIDAVAFGAPTPFSIALFACLTKQAEEIVPYLGPRDEDCIVSMAID